MIWFFALAGSAVLAVIFGALWLAHREKQWEETVREEAYEEGVEETVAYFHDLVPGEPETAAFEMPEPEPKAEVCCACGSEEVGYHNYLEQPFCWPCADGDRPILKAEAYPLTVTGSQAWAAGLQRMIDGWREEICDEPAYV